MVVLRAAETTPVPVQLDLELAAEVESFLQRMMQSFIKKVGETVSLVCAHTITVAVLDSLSGSAIAWFLNDFPMEMDPSRILYNKGNIDITDLTPGDSGVYTCLVEWGPENAKDNITVGVYSLVVTADSPTRYVFEKDGMRLVCNSLSLGFLFPAATRQWFYNGTNVTTPIITLASNASEEVVPRVSMSMAGEWECRVNDWETQRAWITAWFRLGVQSEPSAIARAYRFLTDHVYAVIVVASIIFILICLVFIYSVKVMKDQETETDEEFHNTRNGWEKTFNEFGSGGKVKVNESDLPPKKKDDEEGGGEGAQKKEGTDEGDLDNMEDKGERASSKVNLLGDGEHEEEGMGDAGKGNEGDVDKEKNDDVDKDTKESAGDGGDDGGGEESDTNKSANLSKRARRRSKHKVRWQSKDRRNAVLMGNNENISNIDRRATREDAMAIKLGERTEDRQRGDRKRKKRRERIVYPEVSKESALKWLMQNSPQLKRFQSILSDRGNTTAAQTRNVEPVRSMGVGREAYHEDLNRASASTCGEAQEQLWRLPEFKSADIRTWLTRGRERLAGWTTKPSSWGHSDIRYSVLPQADEDDFMYF